MGHLLQSRLLHGHVSAGIDLGGGNIDMAENITDIDNINAGFQRCIAFEWRKIWGVTDFGSGKCS